MPAREVIVVAYEGGDLAPAVERHLHRAWEPEPPVFVFHRPGAEPPAHLAQTVGLAYVAASRGPLAARWAIARRSGVRVASADWAAFALSGEALRVAVPSMPGAGLEVALAIDVARAGLVVEEVPGGATAARRSTPREVVEVGRAYLSRR